MTQVRMSRVVADTNVYSSALLFGGLPGAFLDLALLGALTLVTSAVLLEELEDKLRLKFQVSAEDVAVIRARLEQAAEVAAPEITLAVIRDDPDDDRVLECAVQGRADCIVSGDRHLLRLGTYAGMAILTVRHFLDALQAEARP